MPQLDKITFFNQIFYLLLFFGILYIFMVMYGLPTIVTALKVRHLFLVRLRENEYFIDIKPFIRRLDLILISLVKNSHCLFENLRMDLLKSYKQISFFLMFCPEVSVLHQKYMQEDIRICLFKYDRSTNAQRAKEKLEKEVYKYNRLSSC